VSGALADSRFLSELQYTACQMPISKAPFPEVVRSAFLLMVDFQWLDKYGTIASANRRRSAASARCDACPAWELGVSQQRQKGDVRMAKKGKDKNKKKDKKK